MHVRVVMPVNVFFVCCYVLLYVLFDTGISTHYGRNFQVELEFNAQTRMHVVACVWNHLVARSYLGRRKAKHYFIARGAGSYS